MTKQKEEKQLFSCRLPMSTVKRVRWLTYQQLDIPGNGRLGEVTEMLLNKALDELGVPSAADLEQAGETT